MSSSRDLPKNGKRRQESMRLSSPVNNENRLSSHLPGMPSSPTRSMLSNLSDGAAAFSFPNREGMMEEAGGSLRLPNESVSKAIRNYLVNPEDAVSNSDASIISNEDNPDRGNYSASYNLKGGSITRDIYRWHEDRENSTRSRRSLSFSGLYPTNSLHDNEEAQGDSNFPVGDMLQPGGFRRHFVHQKAIEEGRDPNILTHTFIDFLALYGHFAGEDYPSDEDDEDQEDAERGSDPSYSQGGRFRQDLATRDDDDETTPLRGPQKPKPTPVGTASSQKCFLLLMKSFVGTGVLFLPRSFYNGGMVFSTVTLLLVAAVALYCMLLLVEAHHLCGGSFGDIGKKLYGPYARYAVLGSIVLSQLGFCCAYSIFIAKTMRELVVTVTDCKVDLPESAYIYGQLLVYIPMAMVRKIKYFSAAALVADVFILAGLGYIYYFDIQKLATVGPAVIQNFNSDSFALMIGTAIFTFEGIGLVLPIAESMKEPKEFPKILSWTVGISAFIFTSVAALCYAVFGDKVDAVVLLNLPREKPVVQGVQFLYSLAITFSVPLQLFPAIRILESAFFPRRSGKEIIMVKWQKNMFRTGICLFFATIAFLGAASLDNFVSMIGAFACVPLCFIYPAMFHLKAISTSTPQQISSSPVPISNGPYQILIDTVLAVFGVFMMIYVTIVNIYSWSAPEAGGPDICA